MNGLGLKNKRSGFRSQGFGFRYWRLGFRASDCRLGSRVQVITGFCFGVSGITHEERCVVLHLRKSYMAP